jgi:hypothetical protein
LPVRAFISIETEKTDKPVLLPVGHSFAIDMIFSIAMIPLTGNTQNRAVRSIKERIIQLVGNKPVLIAGDFNP